MLAKTHIPFAALTTVVAAPIIGVSTGHVFTPGQLIIGIGIGSVAGMLPDIDHPGALLSKGKIFTNPYLLPRPVRMLLQIFGTLFSLPPRAVGYFVRGVFGHRGGTHSFLFLGLWSLLGAPLYAAFFFACAWILSVPLQFTPLQFEPGLVWSSFSGNIGSIMPISIICIGLGYFSHLFSDSLNTVGVPWFWPKKKFQQDSKTGRKKTDYVRICFLPEVLRIKVDSEAENIFRAVTLVLLLFVCFFNVGSPMIRCANTKLSLGTRCLRI